MPALPAILRVLPLVAGVLLLGLGVQRLGRPYEDGRHFDPATGVVAHVQTAEALLVVGALLCVVGLVLLARRAGLS